jgi:hypothetical protein
MERGGSGSKGSGLSFFACILELLFQRGVMGFMAKFSLLGMAAIFGLIAWISFKAKKGDG